MGKKRVFAALLTAGIAALSSCGGSFQQPQYTTYPERTSVAPTEENDMETNWLEKLTALVPPPKDPKCTGNDEMRIAAEKQLGAKLPDDYIELVNTYGDGCFGYTFNVFNPFSDNKYYNLLTNEEKYCYETIKEYDETGPFAGVPDKWFESQRTADGKVPLYGGWCDNEGYPFDYFPAENGILACCQADGQYTVYWKTGGDRWTIVAYCRSGEYSEFDMTLTEFLYKEIAQEINFGDMYCYLTEQGKVFIPAEETKDDCKITEGDYKFNA